MVALAQVLVREPSTPHLYMQTSALSCAHTLLKPLLGLRQVSGNEGQEKISIPRPGHGGPHKGTHLHTHLLSPDPLAQLGWEFSSQKGQEEKTAHVATPDAWELLPPPAD